MAVNNKYLQATAGTLCDVAELIFGPWEEQIIQWYKRMKQAFREKLLAVPLCFWAVTVLIFYPIWVSVYCWMMQFLHWLACFPGWEWLLRTSLVWWYQLLVTNASPVALRRGALWALLLGKYQAGGDVWLWGQLSLPEQRFHVSPIQNGCVPHGS